MKYDERSFAILPGKPQSRPESTAEQEQPTMKRILLIAAGMVALLVGCTAPVQLRYPDGRIVQCGPPGCAPCPGGIPGRPGGPPCPRPMGPPPMGISFFA